MPGGNCSLLKLSRCSRISVLSVFNPRRERSNWRNRGGNIFVEYFPGMREEDIFCLCIYYVELSAVFIFICFFSRIIAWLISVRLISGSKSGSRMNYLDSYLLLNSYLVGRLMNEIKVRLESNVRLHLCQTNFRTFVKPNAFVTRELLSFFTAPSEYAKTTVSPALYPRKLFKLSRMNCAGAVVNVRVFLFHFRNSHVAGKHRRWIHVVTFVCRNDINPLFFPGNYAAAMPYYSETNNYKRTAQLRRRTRAKISITI